MRRSAIRSMSAAALWAGCALLPACASMHEGSPTTPRAADTREGEHDADRSTPAGELGTLRWEPTTRRIVCGPTATNIDIGPEANVQLLGPSHIRVTHAGATLIARTGEALESFESLTREVTASLSLSAPASAVRVIGHTQVDSAWDRWDLAWTAGGTEFRATARLNVIARNGTTLVLLVLSPYDAAAPAFMRVHDNPGLALASPRASTARNPVWDFMVLVRTIGEAGQPHHPHSNESPAAPGAPSTN